MNRRLLAIAALLSVIGSLAGCASSSPDQSFARVQTLVGDRIGKRVQWNTGSSEDRAVAAQVRTLLARPLTAEAAVQIALLNNRKLQATFEELGIAQADFVQAGLLENPILNFSARFPTTPPRKTYLDIAAAENLLNVFIIPARRRIAAAQREQATARVTDEVLSLAAETESTFYTYQAAEQTVELRLTIADAAAASLDAATRLHQAGNTTDLDYYGERAQAAHSTVELANARADATDAQERLNELMGLWGLQTQWTVAGRLPDPPADEVRPEGLERLAVRQRQDLEAARQDVLAQARLYGFTVDTRFFAQADLGAEGERETDGQWRIGPALSVPIPLVDQGQAAIPRAAAVLRQSEQRYAALAVDNPGDWAMHCHMTHHVMNQMGHGVPNMVGVKPGDLDQRVGNLLPAYMTMGETGMGEMGEMQMPVPKNSIPMLMGKGQFGIIDMGGMFTVVKVREQLTGYDDPGDYKFPRGTVAAVATADDLRRDNISIPASPATRPMNGM